MQPNWQLHINDQLIRNHHLQSLTLIDKRGLEADQLSLTFSDTCLLYTSPSPRD